MTAVLLIVAVLWLAYSNGANDNFKGVATLYSSATASYRKALLWATMATVAGSLASLVTANKLLAAFSGKGLVPQALIGTPELLIAVGAGSAITIFLATRLGLPTSTTHALTGALLGAAVVTSTGSIGGATGVGKFAGPLLLSPVIAIVMSAALYPALRRLRLAARASPNKPACAWAVPCHNRFAFSPTGLLHWPLRV